MHAGFFKTIGLLVIAWIVAVPAKAQSGKVGLYFVNATSQIPIQEVTVESLDSSIRKVADDQGYLELNNSATLPTQFRISSIGYETITIKLAALAYKQQIAIVQLQPQITSLQAIKVSATSNKGIFKTISDLDIHLRPINNSQEVLRLVPGLFIGQHAGGGKAEQLFLRGFDLDHGTDINISVDGLPVNMVSHAHGQGYADLHFVIPEMIDKVNFNKGPYFADKGNFTTAGFVEFKTKDFIDRNFVKVEGGQFETYRTIAAINLLKPQKERRNRSLFFAGEGSFTKGYFDSPQNFSRFNGLLKYYHNIQNKHTITATLSGFTSQWNASGQIPNRAVENGLVGFYGAIDDTEGGKTSRYNAHLSVQSKLANGGTMAHQLFYSKYMFELYSNFTFYKEDSVNGDQIRQKENRDIIGYNGTYQRESHWGKLKTVTRAGFQLRYDYIHHIELSRTKDRLVVTKGIMLGNIKEMNAGAYWSQQVFITNRLNITAAIRGDYFYNQYDDLLAAQKLSTRSAIVSPKLNFQFTLTDQVQLYWYNGRGFHSNDTRVVTLQQGKKVLPPAYGSDVGAIYKIGNKWVLQSAVWYLWLDQEFVYVGDEGVVEAGGQTRRLGIDFSARYQLGKYWFADADVSYANPRSILAPRNQNYLPLAPRFTSVGGITYRKEKGWNGSLRYRLMTNRPANEDYSVVAKGYCIVDAAVNYTTQNWELGLSVQNLLNSRWKETQFDTESRLRNEANPVSEIHFTPGTPFFARLNCSIYF